MMKHTCAVFNCDVAIPTSQLMCREHWFQVPSKLRSKVWNRYRQWQQSPTKETGKALRAAQREAVQSLVKGEMP